MGMSVQTLLILAIVSLVAGIVLVEGWREAWAFVGERRYGLAAWGFVLLAMVGILSAAVLVGIGRALQA